MSGCEGPPKRAAAREPAIIFTRCGVDAEVPAHTGGRRRQVVVNGRKVKTIDAHAHCMVPEARGLVDKSQFRPRKMNEDYLDLRREDTLMKRIRLMDEQGIDVEVLSINPYWYKLERDLAVEIVNIQNQRLAEVCATKPQRFVAFASVTLQHPELAVQQLQNAVKKLGLRGIAVGSHVNDTNLSDPKFHPVWAKAEELGAVVFIHSSHIRAIEPWLQGNGFLENAIGNPLSTTIALSHLIFEGTLDRYPGLKILAAHGGGYLPSYAGRSDRVLITYADKCDLKLKKKPSEYLKQLYYDALVFTPEALRHLAAEVGTNQIVMGTDCPFPWEDAPVDHILNTPGFSDAERIAMLSGNAAKLLSIDL